MNKINYNEIDKECIELVRWFNENGLSTCFSCQGHESDKLNTYYIMFDESVTYKTIEELIQKYSNKHNHSPFLGQFVQWIRKMSGGIVTNWVYQVITKDDNLNYKWAKHDLKILKSI